MQHPDEGTIHAWLDGELPEDQATEIAAHLSDCPECSAIVAEARGLIAASTRILTALDNVPVGVIPEVAVRVAARVPASAPRRRWYNRTDIRAAAALAIVAGASFLVVQRDTGASRQTLTVADKIQARPAATADKPAMEPPVAAAPVAEAITATSPPAVSSIAGALTVTSKRGKAADSAYFSGKGLVGGATLSEVVIAGVATGNVANLPLREISVDSAKTTRRTVYEISPGVRVTLAESPVDTAKYETGFSALLKRRSADAPQRVADASDEKSALDNAGTTEVLRATVQSSGQANAKVAQPMMAAPASAPVINTISWMERGRRYVLSGPLTTEQLQALKTRLMLMRR